MTGDGGIAAVVTTSSATGAVGGNERNTPITWRPRLLLASKSSGKMMAGKVSPGWSEKSAAISLATSTPSGSLMSSPSPPPDWMSGAVVTVAP